MSVLRLKVAKVTEARAVKGEAASGAAGGRLAAGSRVFRQHLENFVQLTCDQVLFSVGIPLKRTSVYPW